VDTVCKGFEDYAQATAKASGRPTLIRLMTHEGNMNPRMSEVDIVPDDDLNTRLKFYVSTAEVIQFPVEPSVSIQIFRVAHCYLLELAVNKRRAPNRGWYSR
jgi:hypothetical protein